MTTRLRTYIAASAAVIALALSACSGGASAPASGAAGGQSLSSDQALADLKKAGVLKVGTEGTYSPFNYHDEKTQELTGYDVEVITAVANKLGVKVEFSETKWDAIFAGLESKRFDVIAGQVTVTEERTQKYDMTDPYTFSVPVGIVAENNTEITSVESIKGKVSAQSATSNWRGVAEESGATVETVEGFTEAVTAIRDGRVDLTINDNLAVADYLKKQKNPGVKIAFKLPEKAVNQAFVLRKDSGLVPAFNQALEELAADGTLAKISEKYFGEDVSIPPTGFAGTQSGTQSGSSAQSGATAQSGTVSQSGASGAQSAAADQAASGAQSAQ